MPVAPINSFPEFQTLIKSGKVVIIDFWATWCGPCRMISPVFEGLSGKFTDIEFRKVDVDEQQDIAQEVSIKAMPTFLAFKDGVKVGEVVGANPGGLQDLVNKGAALV